MKWAEFKRQVEAAGVKDDTDIGWIDGTYDAPYHYVKVSFISPTYVHIWDDWNDED